MDKATLTGLIRDYTEPLLRHVARLTFNDWQQAEDIVQETFLVALGGRVALVGPAAGRGEPGPETGRAGATLGPTVRCTPITRSAQAMGARVLENVLGPGAAAPRR
jgi:Sigma-70 region 2